jgi:hypothetical protein
MTHYQLNMADYKKAEGVFKKENYYIIQTEPADKLQWRKTWHLQ